LLLLGVTFWGWQADDIVILCWLEGWIIALFTIIKIGRITTYNAYKDMLAFWRLDTYLSGFGKMLLFLFFYGSFWCIYGLILNLGLNINVFDYSQYVVTYQWNLIAMALGQFISLKLGFLDMKKYQVRLSEMRELPIRYTLLSGAAMMLGAGFFGNSTIVLIMLVLLKIFNDFLAYYFDNTRYSENTSRKKDSKTISQNL
jgi:hypothetical protein